MKKFLYLITFIVAFCSIAYELILGQTLSAFLGNTVLRYSITVGIYLFAMGIGAMIAEGKFVKNFILNFVKTEIALTLLGGFVVIIFFLLNFLFGSNLFFSILVHLLIFVIGIMTGFEIPFLMEAQKTIMKENKALILGIDYAGAFVGSLVFAFVFYPQIGIVLATFVVGSLNAFAGLLFLFVFSGKSRKNRIYSRILWLMLFVMIFLALNHSRISASLIEKYLR
jgi:spermidine synthase